MTHTSIRIQTLFEKVSPRQKSPVDALYEKVVKEAVGETEARDRWNSASNHERNALIRKIGGFVDMDTVATTPWEELTGNAQRAIRNALKPGSKYLEHNIMKEKDTNISQRWNSMSPQERDKLTKTLYGAPETRLRNTEWGDLNPFFKRDIIDHFRKESYKEHNIKVGDKVHSPSGYNKVIKVDGNKITVRSNDPAGDFEYDVKQVQKESFKETKDKNGRAILGGSRVRTPTGKLGYVYQIVDDADDGELVRVTSQRQTGLLGWFQPKDLVVVGKESVKKEAMFQRDGFKVGDTVKVKTGQHSGRRGKIINLSPDWIRLRLDDGTVDEFDDEELKKESLKEARLAKMVIGRPLDEKDIKKLKAAGLGKYGDGGVGYWIEPHEEDKVRKLLLGKESFKESISTWDEGKAVSYRYRVEDTSRDLEKELNLARMKLDGSSFGKHEVGFSNLFDRERFIRYLKTGKENIDKLYEKVAGKKIYKELSPQAAKRMDDLVRDVDMRSVMRGAQGIMKDLRADGFSDADIKEYIMRLIS